jgi:hypothetical protein
VLADLAVAFTCRVMPGIHSRANISRTVALLSFTFARRIKLAKLGGRGIPLVGMETTDRRTDFASKRLR